MPQNPYDYVGTGSPYYGSGFSNLDAYLNKNNLDWGNAQTTHFQQGDDFTSSPTLDNWLIDTAWAARPPTPPKPPTPPPPAPEDTQPPPVIYEPEPPEPYNPQDQPAPRPPGGYADRQPTQPKPKPDGSNVPYQPKPPSTSYPTSPGPGNRDKGETQDTKQPRFTNLDKYLEAW